ncbi:hypothetical protein JRO89_XS08G0002000 [Xanthoceras sorbifolium]|uniref:Uncharacterized protein n=1 Tax=Xanthoceras sorbifolium TaxID=99658 RepID=A0ABQ8HMX4_9ROSI|nr:hypothetical protein JRO89_XS08G0002000 [Xanthoceras sorbifolium]
MENNQYTWEEQAVRLQAEMAKIQYLQYLLQPPTISNNMNSASSSFTHDLDTINLLNSLASIKDNSSFPNSSSSSQLDIGAVSVHQSVHNSTPFSHMPDLQIPNNCSYQTLPPSLSNNKDSLQSVQNSPLWLGTSSSSTPSPPSIAPPPPPPLTEISINNLGDACSTSSYGGVNDPSVWPEFLLEDPLFHEIA